MSDSSPQVIIIAGPNGAGKTTLAPLILRDALGWLEFVNADAISAGLSAFDPESVAITSGRIMLQRLRQLSSNRENFAFESTLASRSYAGWIGELLLTGYEFHLLFLSLRRVELAIERVAERVKAGGHDIPEDIIRRRYVRGRRNFFELYLPLAKTWAVYDNSTGSPSLLATGRHEFTYTIADPAQWDEFIEPS